MTEIQAETRYTALYEAFLTQARAQVAERDAAYAAEVAEYRDLGYRARYCPHGMNQWVDYDNICGPCEESLTPEQEATRLADDAYAEWNLAFDTLNTLSEKKRRGYTVPDDVLLLVSAWIGARAPGRTDS